MTFDEVDLKNELSDFISYIDGELEEPLITKVQSILNSLKQEYAPTVEMTKRHKYNLIYMKNEGYSFFETIADIDSGVLIREFDSYWNPLTVDELMKAWLHQETIKVVDEEK